MSGVKNRVWRLNGFGLAHLALAEAAAPQLGHRELLVRVRAVSLNHRDKLPIGGALAPNLALPYVPASDAAGEVVAAGPAVQRFRVGQRLIGLAVTDWIDGEGPPVLHTRMLSAGLPGSSQRMYRARRGRRSRYAVDTHRHTSRDLADRRPHCMVRLGRDRDDDPRPERADPRHRRRGAVCPAVRLGLRPIVTCSSDEKLVRARELGAWNVVNYRRTPDWDLAALEMTAGTGVDHVLELADGDSLRKSVNALAVGGQLSLIGILADTQSSLPTAAVTRKRLTIRGIAMGHRKAFERMNRAINAKVIKPVVDAVYPFEDAVRAFEHLANGPFGKVVISLA